VGPISVIDISPTGIALEPRGEIILAPGSQISALEISFRGAVIWKGPAQVIYHVEGPPTRVGLRFTSRLLDLQLLKLEDQLVGSRLGKLLRQQEDFSLLPPEWRSLVTQVRHLFESAREVLSEAEDRLSEDPEVRTREERGLFERIFEKWGPMFHEQVSLLHEKSKSFDEETEKNARAFAARELLSLTYPCPIHSRAYEKPLGYAGDFKIMLLLMNDHLEGETIFGRFLHFTTQNYSLGRTVRSRERTMRREVMEVVAKGKPSRIAALACGPAIEIQRFLRRAEKIDAPTEFILVDQDEQTMQYCHENLTRVLMEREVGDSHLVTLNGLHLSVIQILRPQSDAEKAFIEENLSNLDLIYSAGLYDYLPDAVARRLTRRLYSMLRPGGKLFIGNLVECPDSTWMMEFVSSWFLEYRSEESMLKLASPLAPAPAVKRIVLDHTGRCLFLEITRPENSLAE
jgi:extracellular factor (EF) 3-hydroxypalmitic acid methyl ester biosynthesis protein